MSHQPIDAGPHTFGFETLISSIIFLSLRSVCAQYGAVKLQGSSIQPIHSQRRSRARRFVPVIVFAILTLPSRAHASMFQGETLDSIANGISWVVLVIAPIIGIAAFWMVHILPEKIAEKKRHPQVKAIQCVCLLSLCFGGLLWPLAWLWTYTKPVLHKMAYGTDVGESHGHGENPKHGESDDETRELTKLRTRVAELEAKIRS
jgi:cytochrome bd-type quinol oxidase subunit 2